MRNTLRRRNTGKAYRNSRYSCARRLVKRLLCEASWTKCSKARMRDAMTRTANM